MKESKPKLVYRVFIAELKPNHKSTAYRSDGYVYQATASSLVKAWDSVGELIAQYMSREHNKAYLMASVRQDIRANVVTNRPVVIGYAEAYDREQRRHMKIFIHKVIL